VLSLIAITEAADIFNDRKSEKVFKINNLTDEEATLIEPAACAIHGVDKLALPVGSEVLVMGAGTIFVTSSSMKR